MKNECEFCGGCPSKNGKIQRVDIIKVKSLKKMIPEDKLSGTYMYLCTKCRHFLGITTKKESMTYSYQEVV